MQLLDDRYRTMLIQAADGGADQFDNAVATIDLWWPTMPEPHRNNIGFAGRRWAGDHPRAATPDVLNKRRLLMRHLKPPRSGACVLRTALRLP